MPKLSGPLVLLAAFGGFFLALFLVFQVVDSEFFRGDPDLGGSAVAVKNAKTLEAHARCAEAAHAAHPPADYTAWDLGFDRYLVKVGMGDGAVRPYLCRALNPGGAEAWTVQSLEYLD